MTASAARGQRRLGAHGVVSHQGVESGGIIKHRRAQAAAHDEPFGNPRKQVHLKANIYPHQSNTTIRFSTFPRESNQEYLNILDKHYAYRVRDRLRREVLVPLRKALELPEVYMCACKFEELPYRWRPWR